MRQILTNGRITRAFFLLAIAALVSTGVFSQWNSSRTIDAQAVPSVTRSAASESVVAGDLVTITLTPFAVSSFYAVREDFGGLELVSHTADAFDSDAFVSITNQPFSYVLQIPATATVGQQFTLSGDFWEDPGAESQVDPAQTVLTVVAADATVVRTLSANTLNEGETVTVTLTPSGISDFYAVREDLDGLELVSHNADAFEDGVFVRLGSGLIEYTVELPDSAINGETFDISGRFWEDPGLEREVSPAVSQITSTVPAPTATRSLSASSVGPGETVTVTITPDEIDLFYAVKEELGDLQLIDHTADGFEADTFIRLSATPFTYTVRVPLTANDGEQLPISGQLWEDPEVLWDVDPATSVINVTGTAPAASVTRSVQEEIVQPGEIVTVTVMPEGIDLFYAVQEDVGQLALLSHTADSFENGAFLMLTPDPFTYDVQVPPDADPQETFDLSGVFWEDPGAELPVSPAVTQLSVEPAVGLSFVTAEVPLGIGETHTVEVHVDDLQGVEIDTVQLKIEHDPAEVEITNVSCIGIMDTGTPSSIQRDESTNSSWFSCFTTVQDGASGNSGPVISFDVTRIGSALPTLEMITGGATGTEIFRSGLAIEKRVLPLNVLELLPDTTLSGIVTLQGVTDEQAFAAIAPEISLIPTQGGRATSASVNPDGTFEVRGVVDGTYDVVLDAPGSLGRYLTGLVISGSDVALQPVELRSGRADSDDIVAGADISAVAGNFGLGPNELDGRLAPDTGLIVDFDGDGWVTGFDISIVQSNMGESRFQEWTDPAASP